jgi:hypothetical protein
MINQRWYLVLGLATCTAACLGGTPDRSGSPGGAGGQDQEGGASGQGGAGTGGKAGGGGSGAGGKATGGSGGSPTPDASAEGGSGGGGTGAGGMAGAGAGGMAGAGAGGMAGAGAGGMAGAGAGGAGGMTAGGVAGALHDQVFAVPCPAEGTAGSCNITMRKFAKMFTLGGDPATTYKVKLKVCAVFEGRSYMGGMALAEAMSHVYVGGMPANPNQFAVTYPVVSMKVGAPMQTYYMNSATLQEYADKIMLFDYTATFDMKGGTTVLFESDGGSNGGTYTAYQAGKNAMCPMPPGITRQPYSGQFMHVQVVSTEPMQ